MKNFLKIVAVLAIAGGLAACADDNNANTSDNMTGMSKYQQCAAVKNKMRMLDRSQPGAQKQYNALESQLTKLNCGAK